MTAMSDAEHKPGGWSDSLKRLSDSLLGLAHSRIELVAVELQEEKLRAVNLLVWIFIAMTLGVAGLLGGMAVLALLFWHVFGYAGLAGLALIALAGASVVLWRVCQRIRTGPLPFSQTLAEFRKDRECLLRKD
jgi:uncharacterized membrane protein YqjE